MRLRRLLTLAAACLTIATVGRAQGVPTGTLSGQVLDPDGLPLPGVKVTVSSPSLQGVRSAVTSAHGDYIVPFLPAGEYVVNFELGGFQRQEKKVRLAVAAQEPLDVRLALGGVQETVNVVTEAPSDFTQTAAVATSYRSDLVEKLPLGRDLRAAVLLAPGTSDNGPGGNIMISGAVSFENLFLVNGVVVNETLRGQALPLFIEDAIQETKTSTGNISAEYGRFAGGVVNMITKSGGNQFSGSFRTTFNSDHWRSLTPYEEKLAADPRVSAIVPTYEATFGGPILKDKLWFFVAGRYTNSTTSRVMRYTDIPYQYGDQDRRLEAKLTYALNARHSVKLAYTGNKEKWTNRSFDVIMDRASLYDREDPQHILSVNYTGVLSSNFFVEGQFSSRQFTFVGSGSRYEDLVKGTTIFDRSRSSARWNSPTFCAVCGAAPGQLNREHRDNQDVLVKASYFVSSKSLGSHNLVAGFDAFDNQRKNNNYQSGSGYRVYATNTIFRGTGESTVLYPVLDKGTRIYWVPLVENSRGSHMRTYSGFVNDVWRLNNKLTFNLGVRYDRNDDADQSGVKVASDAAFSPRLSATFDPKGDGSWVLTGGFGRYVTDIAAGVGDSGSAGGRTATYRYDYLGPVVNTDLTTPNPVPVDQALGTLFDWFFANGGTNRATRDAPSVPGVTTRVDTRLKSPHSDEYTVGLSRRLGAKGLARVDGVYRKFGDFYGDKRDMSTGTVTDPTGRAYDLLTVVNTNAVERSYKGLNAQVQYQIAARLALGSAYTLSWSRGNFVGETASSGPDTASVGDYPEYRQKSWNYPVGLLPSDQRHKVRVWLNWDVPVPSSFGRANLGWLQRFDSATPYSLAGTVNPKGYVVNPGYLTPPTSVTYYFGGRGSLRADDTWRSDLALNWSRDLGIGRKAQLFFRGTIVNLFDEAGLIGPDSTIYTADNDPAKKLTAFDPFRDTPMEGVNWAKGPDFGAGLTAAAYQTPRTLTFAVGVRF